MRKRKSIGIRILKGIYIFIVILSGLIVAAFCTYKVMVRPPEMEMPSETITTSDSLAVDGERPDGKASSTGLTRKEGVYTFLIFGMDDGNGNTDTIMVGSYDTIQQNVHVVSIPRDTLIETDRANKRINAVYASENGVESLERELSDMLGIPIDFYVKVNLQAFVAIVDAVDGVDYDVPVDMDYEDPTQDLYIHLKAGMQHLDGQQALQLVRCRSAYPNQDLGRMSTQQGFLTALASKVFQLGNLSKVQEFASIFNQYVETDLSLENIIWFGEKLLGMSTRQLSFETIPIHDVGYLYEGRSYVTLKMDEVVDVVNEKLNPYTENISLSDMDMISIENGTIVHSQKSWKLS